MLELKTNKGILDQCKRAVLVPEKSVEEPGYIQTSSGTGETASKHEYHAMAQMAYFQYQDDEIAIMTTESSIAVSSSENTTEITSGLVIYLSDAGEIKVVSTSGVNIKKLLETAYRFCTRWVRLDI